MKKPLPDSVVDDAERTMTKLCDDLLALAERMLPYANDEYEASSEQNKRLEDAMKKFDTAFESLGT